MSMKEAIFEVLSIFIKMNKEDYTIIGACMLISTVFALVLFILIAVVVYMWGGLT